MEEETLEFYCVRSAGPRLGKMGDVNYKVTELGCQSPPKLDPNLE